MGAQISKSDSESETELFTPEEIAHFKGLLSTLDESGRATCSAKNFQKHCDSFLDESLALKLTQRLSIASGSVISQSEFMDFFGRIFRGSHEDRVRSLFELASSGSGCLSKDELMQFTESLVRSYIKSAEKSHRFQSWKPFTEITPQTMAQFSEFLLSSVFYPDVEPKEIFTATHDPDVLIGLEDLIDGLSRPTKILLDIQSSVFSHCFSFQEKEYLIKLIPHCLHAKRYLLSDKFSMFDIPRIMFINSQLPTELRREWRYLFSSAVDGENFTHLLSSIKHQGATVIVVKDETGRIFGGFVDECWAAGPKFHGSDACFLFHLHPKMLAYRSTGFNSNFQYLNIQQQTMPNGLGLGGKLDYFGLWIDAEFGKGKCSPSCTTFESPQLSEDEEFEIEAIEVWGVGPIPEYEESLRDPEGAKSIIDQDPQVRAVLELIDKPPVSDGYRDIKKAHEEIND